MKATWDAYSLLSFRCSSLQPIESKTLGLLNGATQTKDILEQVTSEQGSSPALLAAFMHSFNISVHRSATARRPYWEMGPMKTADRIEDKAAMHYSMAEPPTTAYVLDIVRCRVHLDDPFTLAMCYFLIDALKDIVRVKNRFDTATAGGWRDVMVNYRHKRDPHGLICELQLLHGKLPLLPPLPEASACLALLSCRDPKHREHRAKAARALVGPSSRTCGALSIRTCPCRVGLSLDLLATLQPPPSCQDTQLFWRARSCHCLHDPSSFGRCSCWRHRYPWQQGG